MCGRGPFFVAVVERGQDPMVACRRRSSRIPASDGRYGSNTGLPSRHPKTEMAATMRFDPAARAPWAAAETMSERTRDGLAPETERSQARSGPGRTV